MDKIIYALAIVAGLLVVIVLVVLHELGHAIMARRNGVVVKEFGIGFPPRAWSKKLKNGTLLSLNWLPLGGFVQLKGEHDSAMKKGDYGAASYWAKTKILLAGVVVNWLSAMVIFMILAVVGVPKLLPNQFTIATDTRVEAQPVTIARLTPGGAAEKAGFQRGDTVISIAGEKVDSPEELVALTPKLKKQRVPIVYVRHNAQATAEVVVGDGSKSQGLLGVVPQQRVTYFSTWSAPIVGIGLTAQLSWETLKGLGVAIGNLAVGLFQNLSFDRATRQAGGEHLSQAGDSVTGPIGLFGVFLPGAVQAGPQILLTFTAVVSLTLALMNVLPIPAFDGGRWFVMTVYRVWKRPLSKKREEQIHGTGFMVLLGLVALISILDVTKILQ